MKFFRLNTRRLQFDVKDHISRFKIFYLGLLGVFVIGIAVGIFASGISGILFVDNALNYFYRLFNGGFNFFSHFLSRFLSNLLFVLIISVFSLHVFCFPLQVLYIFYRGFILGTACKTIVALFSFTGIINIIVIIVPMQIVIMFLLFFCCVIGDSRSLACFRNRNYSYFWRSFPEFLEILLHVVIVSAAICLIECLLIVLVAFPLNSVFL